MIFTIIYTKTIIILILIVVCSIGYYVNCEVIPSLAPTRRPSRNPTIAPSRSPSHAPTRKPSNQPTFRPTRAPSASPTRKPSNQPTVRPTRAPSASPTRKPSNQPTFRPSPGPPTVIPSQLPTLVPTSAEPTLSPTLNPTLEPSTPPTAAPTNRPTSPSSQPTSEPTPFTPYPTGQPTAVPTSSPTISSQPTSVPSTCPSSQPSVQPSSSPTSAPSAIPTATPTSTPSSIPSSFPTSFPTSYPTNTVQTIASFTVTQEINGIDISTFTTDPNTETALINTIIEIIPELSRGTISITDVVDINDNRISKNIRGYHSKVEKHRKLQIGGEVSIEYLIEIIIQILGYDDSDVAIVEIEALINDAIANDLFTSIMQFNAITFNVNDLEDAVATTPVQTLLVSSEIVRSAAPTKSPTSKPNSNDALIQNWSDGAVAGFAIGIIIIIIIICLIILYVWWKCNSGVSTNKSEGEFCVDNGSTDDQIDEEAGGEIIQAPSAEEAESDFLALAPQHPSNIDEIVDSAPPENREQPELIDPALVTNNVEQEEGQPTTTESNADVPNDESARDDDDNSYKFPTKGDGTIIVGNERPKRGSVTSVLGALTFLKNKIQRSKYDKYAKTTQEETDEVGADGVQLGDTTPPVTEEVYTNGDDKKDTTLNTADVAPPIPAVNESEQTVDSSLPPPPAVPIGMKQIGMESSTVEMSSAVMANSFANEAEVNDEPINGNFSISFDNLNCATTPSSNNPTSGTCNTPFGSALESLATLLFPTVESSEQETKNEETPNENDCALPGEMAVDIEKKTEMSSSDIDHSISADCSNQTAALPSDPAEVSETDTNQPIQNSPIADVQQTETHIDQQKDANQTLNDPPTETDSTVQQTDTNESANDFQRTDHSSDLPEDDKDSHLAAVSSAVASIAAVVAAADKALSHEEQNSPSVTPLKARTASPARNQPLSARSTKAKRNASPVSKAALRKRSSRNVSFEPTIGNETPDLNEDTDRVLPQRTLSRTYNNSGRRVGRGSPVATTFTRPKSMVNMRKKSSKKAEAEGLSLPMVFSPTGNQSQNNSDFATGDFSTA